jgi:plastocyanin
MTFRGWRTLAVLGMVALGGSATGASAQSGSPGALQILIKDFAFSPMSLTVKAGTTVTWVNKDDEPHTVVSDSGLFRSGAVDADDTFAFKFDKPGTYHFSCSSHPRMIGTIVVQ